MSMFENDQYRWRETYFVMFDPQNRPGVERMKETLSELSGRLTVSNVRTDEQGELESLTVVSPDDFAALDICYVSGEEVREQASQLFEEMTGPACSKGERARLEKLRHCDGRFDVLHFEQVTESDEGDEMLDPSALLIVLEALVSLTDGIAVDPQSGTLM